MDTILENSILAKICANPADFIAMRCTCKRFAAAIPHPRDLFVQSNKRQNEWWYEWRMVDLEIVCGDKRPNTIVPGANLIVLNWISHVTYVMRDNIGFRFLRQRPHCFLEMFKLCRRYKEVMNLSEENISYILGKIAAKQRDMDFISVRGTHIRDLSDICVFALVGAGVGFDLYVRDWAREKIRFLLPSTW